MNSMILSGCAAVLIITAIPHRAAGSEAAPDRTSSFSVPPTNSPELAWWRESMQSHDERIGWWREARFGMFVHWGVYSTLGNEYKGRKGGTYAEHIQRVLKIPIPEYRTEIAGIFNPTNFNADEWIRTAKEAGMGYFIITSKHHDGFAMWPTRVNSYNVMEATPWRHDPMQDLRDACRKHGVKFGFYYSQAFDWGEANGPGNDWDYENPGGDRLIGGRDWWETTPEFLPRARKYVDEKSIPQLLELIRLYDPDIFWFDTASKLPESENLRIMKAVRQASARVVINGRLVRRLGDYVSTADRPAEFAAHEGDWEGIPTTNESYGWSKFDQSHKPVSHFIQLLAKAAARGGNLLMNVGPMGDGRIYPMDVSILQGIGEWWKINGESIRGTTRTPLPVQAWGESTRKGDTLYLHVFTWPADGRLIIGGLKSDVAGAQLLSRPGATLAVRRLNATDVAIEGLPASAPDASDSVIALKCAGPISVDPVRLLQPSLSTEALRVFDASLRGRGLRFGPGKVRDAYVQDWSDPNASIVWAARLNQAATFEVEVEYDAESGSTGNRFSVLFNQHGFSGTVRAGTHQKEVLGRVSLTQGPVEIRWTAAELNGGEVMRPRTLTLKPIVQ